MPILQKKVNDDFTVVHNAFIRDEKLGINARGLLLTMLSMKEGWNFSIKGLASILPDGEKRVSTALHSLEELGYLKRNRLTDKHGKVIEWEYMFSDEPIFLDNIKENAKKNKSNEKEKPHCHFGDVDNGDVDKADVEKRSYNKILNNQIPNNQILSNQSVNLSAKPEASLTPKDGQTDGQISEQKKTMPFSEILNEIGYTNETHFVPESERDFECFNEAERKTDKCQIPYSMKNDKKAMAEAIKFLFAYSCYTPTLPDESKRLLDIVISTLTTMTTQDIHKIQGQTVKYCDVIDRINDIIHDSDSSLFDWFNSFEQKWNKILAENDIKHQKAYMKSCIWNWLNDYAFENDNDLRQLDYRLRNGVI